MVTNGSLLDAEKRALLARSSLQEIVFSLNSLDRTSYAKLMGRDKLPTVLENIDALCSLLESRPQRATVIFSFVTLGANWGEVFDFVDFGARYGRPVSLLGLTPTLAHIYTEDMIVEDTPQNRATLENVRRYAASEAVELSAFHFETQNNVVDQDRSKAALDISDCDWVYTKCFVGIDGELTPCCWSQHGLGSIHGHTLAELWDGEGYRELRALISANDPLYCMNCRKDG
jgi:molybdenum cofactor biosynthesis enzyme MoaA